MKTSPLIFLLILSLTGCASITGSKNQPVSITTSCEAKSISGAACNLRNDKGQWFVTTPGSTVIQKSGQDLAIECKKNNLAASAIFKSRSNGGIWGNILLGGPIGAVVDASSGAGFDYPPIMNVNFSSCIR